MSSRNYNANYERSHYSFMMSVNDFLLLLPPIRPAEIVEFVRKYMEGSSHNLQSLSSC